MMNDASSLSSVNRIQRVAFLSAFTKKSRLSFVWRI